MKTTTQIIGSILIVALQCFFLIAKGQIVYTDFNPDSSLVCTYSCSQQCNLDIDNDGIEDFFVKTFTSICGLGDPQNHYATCGVFGNMQILQANGYPAQLILNDTIGPESEWGNGGTLRSMTFCPSIKYSGNWLSNGFLGLKLVNGGNTYFGWLHLAVTVGPGSASVTMFDFAFNSIDSQVLLAGQTCPPQSVIIANGSLNFCEGDSVILASANTGTNLSYKWKLDGSKIPGATNQNYTAKTGGKYKVKVTDNINNCSLLSDKVIVTVSCKNLNEEERQAMPLQVFPNPFSTSTNISFSLPQSETVSLQIFDVQGRLIRTLADAQMSEGEHILTWNARDDPEVLGGNEVIDGIYFLRMKTESGLKTIKISVTK